MKKVIIKTDNKEVYKKLESPVAKSLWGNFKHQTFKDKTKYTRKIKHKNKLDT